ncbi:MAG TPA: response regulator, partial [Sediminispirochaeta sp.]|nr:response regulator [Sediminispirochaeta sp.]
LYLDDETLNLLAFKSQFRRDFEVHCASNVQEALDILEKQRIDFVFTDQRMPDMWGTEFLAIVKERCPEAHRIVISGFTEDRAIKRGLERGLVHSAFEKPFSSREIIECIKTRCREFD